MTIDHDWVPAAACTLPTIERPLRVAEFDTLFATALTGIERVDATHARLSLAGDAGLAAQARDLAARESGCCSFFDFAVDTEPAAEGHEDVRMDIAVPAPHAAVLEALLTRAESVRGPAGEPR